MAKPVISKKSAEKKPNIFVRMKRYFKEVGAELKKTVWPTKKDLVKYTGVVLAFIVVFAVVVGAMDFALVELLNLIVR
ncbi:preprotein translocase subunit SecE [Christensenella sp. MSJ-20]|uniref:preprotein translocase subunit SecE n=1 Tax=Christensenella sp. MSJ-20 TaxID=2841518 RepID=UPI000D7A4014|nr:MAG: preprotein translocase subunit SecE [Bacillota bacterium]